ncbi:DUF2304 domain-containing protein [Lysinibacillus fusiformis]|nr:DUF2304 domain-containing protein [Lysinibacillus fusiformis]
MDTVQLISIIASLLFLFRVLYSTSKNKLQNQQAFMWLILAIVGLMIGIFINFFEFIARQLNIAYMPTIIFLAAFLVILNLLVYHTTIISSQQEKIKDLSQELALLRKNVDDKKSHLNNSGKKKV